MGWNAILLLLACTSILVVADEDSCTPPPFIPQSGVGDTVTGVLVIFNETNFAAPPPRAGPGANGGTPNVTYSLTRPEFPANRTSNLPKGCTPEPFREPTEPKNSPISSSQTDQDGGASSQSEDVIKGLNYAESGGWSNPDQALCVGKQYIVEGVNRGVAVYNRQGERLKFWNMDSFFGGNAVIGQPVCYFDDDTSYFYFVSISAYGPVMVATFPDGWDFGSCYIFAIGYGEGVTLDYPQLGADKYNIWITTNNYNSNSFMGPYILALDKVGITKGSSSLWIYANPSYSAYGSGGFSLYYLRPQALQSGSSADTDNDGTMYFLSRNAYYTSELLVSAITGTKYLSEGRSPSPFYTVSVACTNLTWDIPPVTQPDGSQLHGFHGGIYWTAYAAGKLYGVSMTRGTSDQANLAYHVIQPSFSGGNLQATLLYSDIVADYDGNAMILPSIGVDPSGNAVIAFSYVGPTAHVSLCYVQLNPSGELAPYFNTAVKGHTIASSGYFGRNTAAQYDKYSGMVVFAGQTAHETWTTWIAAKLSVEPPPPPALSPPPPPSRPPPAKAPGPSPSDDDHQDRPTNSIFGFQYAKCCQWKKSCDKNRWRIKCSHETLEKCSNLLEGKSDALSTLCRACLSCRVFSSSTKTTLNVILPPTKPEYACFGSSDVNGEQTYRICKHVTYKCTKVLIDDKCTAVTSPPGLPSYDDDRHSHEHHHPHHDAY